MHIIFRYQKTLLHDSEEAARNKRLSTGSLHIVRQQISSFKHSDLSSSSDEDSNTDDKVALLADDNSQCSPTLLNKLSKHVGFIQPAG